MGSFKDLTGCSFGELTVLKRLDTKLDKGGRRRTMWLCRCSCGNETAVSADALKSGNQVSCGCYRKKHASEMFMKHGMADTRLYYVWSGIKSRCYNSNVYEYRFYGARGISMCEKWCNNFEAFYDWAISNGYDNSAPRGTYTIDRIDTDGDYSPENCRLITQKQQMNNTRTNHILEYNGNFHTIAEWSRITGISQFKIRNRVSRLGWTVERALTTK